ncbi:ATP-dependent RNA helicase dhx8 [Diplonema papillatum]|nr:ATP-dependent RNA helicase dhx8 [Diplonema papillatum]
MVLPRGWQQRVGSNRQPYWFHAATGQTALEEPRGLTDREAAAAKEGTRAAAAAWLEQAANVPTSDARTLGVLLVDLWEESSGVQSFADAVGDDAVPLRPPQREELYHLIHRHHPEKRAGWLATQEYRENAFDPNPPRDWSVRESTSQPGQFYYLHNPSGATSRTRPRTFDATPADEDQRPTGEAPDPEPRPPEPSTRAAAVPSRRSRASGWDQAGEPLPAGKTDIEKVSATGIGHGGGGGAVGPEAAAGFERVLVASEVELRSADDVMPPFFNQPELKRMRVLARAGEESLLRDSVKMVRVAGAPFVLAAKTPSALLDERWRSGATAAGRRRPQLLAADAGAWAATGKAEPPSVAPHQLPIYPHRVHLLRALAGSDCLVVIGETGSGKTTQIPQYLADSLAPSGPSAGGRETQRYMVACTQPRRVSAMSIARRVAAERGSRVGQDVGYAVRFDENWSAEHTVIKYMTDGVLLREVLNDPTLRRYKAVMIDEAHERTVTTDLLLYFIKQIVASGAGLKVIVSSATIEAGRFSQYFGAAPAYFIPGRSYPVETLYLKTLEEDWYAAAVKVVFEVHLEEPMGGDVLVFLTGQDEIDAACQICQEWWAQLAKARGVGPDGVGEMLVLPLYASLPMESQNEVFRPTPAGVRKVIFATNVAETAITVQGIAYVVDTGLAKIKVYHSAQRANALTVTPISQAAARQRAGRAGRTGPGKCFRLFTEPVFDNDLLEQTVPAVRRESLEGAILMLKAGSTTAGVSIENIGLLDQPPAGNLCTALSDLYHLNALDASGQITAFGRRLLSFPLEPSLACVVLRALELGCVSEACAAAAVVCCGTPLLLQQSGGGGDGGGGAKGGGGSRRPPSERTKHAFSSHHGDLMTAARILKHCFGLSRPRMHRWCADSGVLSKAVDTSAKIADQLFTIAARYKPPPAAAAPADDDWPLPGRDSNASFSLENLEFHAGALQKAICAGSGLRCARKCGTEGGLTAYKALDTGLVAAVHPSSVFARLSFAESPAYVVFEELVQTRREYLSHVTAVQPAWLVQYFPSLFRVTETEFRELAADAAREEMAALKDLASDSLDPGLQPHEPAPSFKRRKLHNKAF